MTRRFPASDRHPALPGSPCRKGSPCQRRIQDRAVFYRHPYQALVLVHEQRGVFRAVDAVSVQIEREGFAYLVLRVCCRHILPGELPYRRPSPCSKALLKELYVTAVPSGFVTVATCSLSAADRALLSWELLAALPKTSLENMPLGMSTPRTRAFSAGAFASPSGTCASASRGSVAPSGVFVASVARLATRDPPDRPRPMP